MIPLLSVSSVDAVDPPRQGPHPVLATLGSLTLAAASAVLLALATPPADLGWLGWLAPFPLLLLLVEEAARPAKGFRLGRAFAGGWVWGCLCLLFLATWFAAFAPPGYVAAGVYRGVLAGGVFTGCVALCRRVRPTWWPPVLGAGWVLIEWMYAQGALSFPWGTLSATQHRAILVLQMLDLCGAYGLSFLMTLLSGSVALLLVGLCGSGETRRAGALWVAGSGAVLAVALIRGLVILATPAPDGETVRLALVQASRSEATSGAAVECISNFEDYARWTRTALAARPELILWPESTCEGDAARSAWTQIRLRDLTRGTDSHLLVGSFVADPESGQNTNSAVMLTPEGGLLGQYAKVRIVPFGEYLPARPLLGWTVSMGMPATDLAPGKAWTPITWPRGKVGVSICFESAFGDISRQLTLGGANLLAVLTSDGWVGRESAGLQHAAFAPLRAVETRRGVARAAATGISELIDPYGRPIRSLGMFRQGVVTGELPLRTEITPYVRLGDWPVTLSALILAAAALVGTRRRYISTG